MKSQTLKWGFLYAFCLMFLIILLQASLTVEWASSVFDLSWFTLAAILLAILTIRPLYRRYCRTRLEPFLPDLEPTKISLSYGQKWVYRARNVRLWPSVFLVGLWSWIMSGRLPDLMSGTADAQAWFILALGALYLTVLAAAWIVKLRQEIIA